MRTLLAVLVIGLVTATMRRSRSLTTPTPDDDSVSARRAGQAAGR